jgi:methyl-accepting chemotaxis protein
MALAFPARQVTDTVRSIVTMLIVISVIILAILITMILVIVSSIVRPINLLARSALRLSNGYLTIDPADADSFRRASCKKDEIGDTIRAMDTLIGSMSGIVRSIAASSLEVEKGASAISGTSQLLSQGSTEQASSAEEVSSTIEEIGSTVKQSADNASTTENIARRATADARSVRIRSCGPWRP